MDIAQLIQTLVATVVGGLIVIATNWISKQEERRGAIKEWYEKTYVLEGIEPVATYLYSLTLYFYNKSVGGVVRVKDVDTIPAETVIRLDILFEDSVATDLIAQVHRLMTFQDKSLNTQIGQITYDASSILLNYRKELLKIIATEVRTKHDIVNTSQVVGELRKKADELAKLVEDNDAEL